MSELNLRLPDEPDLPDSLVDVESERWHAEWLVWMCRQIPSAVAALVVSDEDLSGQFHPKAVWPDSTNHDALMQQATEETLRKKQALLTPLDDGKHHLGSYPVFVEGTLRAVITMLFMIKDQNELEQALKVIEHCSAWLELGLARKQLGSLSAQTQRQKLVVDSIADVLGEPDFEHAALRFVNLMGRHLGAERVVLGFVQHGEVAVHSESDSSGHSKKHELVKLSNQALQEAVDQQESIVWPQPEDMHKVTVAHQKLAEAEGKRALLSIPLVDKELCYGAILFDRSPERPFNDAELLTGEALANFVGAVLEEKRQSDLPLYSHAYRSIEKQLARLIGPGHLTRKVTVFSAVLLLVLFSVLNGSYKVGADAVLEGAELRSIVVPFDGYLQRAEVRAGDSAPERTVLAELDTRELRLQRISWISQQATSKRQYEDALAKQERAQVQISHAQVQRAQAEIDLLDYQISQAIMRAPFDALVVSGDLNQRIGSLVRQGEVLFELAPSERFRLAIYVDEFRINDVASEQQGQLVLAALPDEKFPFVVTRINPMAEVRDGATVYRVEAEINSTSDLLRVGLEGVAQVYVDERLLISIWTRSLSDWLKLQYWRFWG